MIKHISRRHIGIVIEHEQSVSSARLDRSDRMTNIGTVYRSTARYPTDCLHSASDGTEQFAPFMFIG